MQKSHASPSPRQDHHIHQDDIKNPEHEIFSTRRPKDFKAGLSSGLKSLAKGVVGGAVGLVAAPVLGAQQEGAVGAAKGLAAGVAGAVLMPILGAGVATAQIIRGAVNTPQAVREASAGKAWDDSTRTWVSCAIIPDNPAYTAARRTYEQPRADDADKRFPFYYNVLGVDEKTVGPAELKKAYYVKARRCHPDKNPGDEQAHRDFQLLGEAYQVLSNEALKRRYDARQDVSGDTDFMASGEFFAMLFGSARFDDFVGELMLSTLARGELEARQIEHLQDQRVEAVARKLLVYLDELAQTDMFEVHVRMTAETRLAPAAYGPIMLVTLGKVYRSQAKRAHGNVLEVFRQQKDKWGTTFNAVVHAVKVMNHQQKLEALEGGEPDGAMQEEQLRLMLDAMWASNAVDIQTTVSKACTTILHDKAVPKQRLKDRARALEVVGDIFLEVGTKALQEQHASEGGEGASAKSPQKLAQERIEKAMQETLAKMDQAEHAADAPA